MGTYLVMINNIKRSFHHKILFLITFLLPVILCLLIGLVNFGKTSIRVGILSEETNQSVLSEGGVLYHILEQSEGIQYEMADAGTLNMDLMTGKYHVILDYRNTVLISNFELLSYQNEDKKVLLKALFKEAVTNGVGIHLSGLKARGLSVTERSIALLLSMFMVLSTVYVSMIIRDRQSGTLLRYQFAKKSKSGYVAGYCIQTFLITFGQILLCMATLLLVQKGFTLSLLEMLLLDFVISAVVTVFSMSICLGSRSEMKSNITASSSASILSLLGGTFVAVETMPGLLRILSFVSPIRWIVELVRLIQ